MEASFEKVTRHRIFIGHRSHSILKQKRALVLLYNINSVPGTTHLFSCLNIQTLVKIILYIFRYNSCMKIFNFRDKELIFFNKIVNGLIQNIEENLEDDIERILKGY